MPQAKAASAFEQLVQVIAPQSKLLRTWPLSGGMSAAMHALELAHPDGQTQKLIVRRPATRVLKQNPQAAIAEFKLLQKLHALGLATPRPYYLDQAGQLFATPALVIEYIDGQPEFAPTDRVDFARQAATHLARLHRIDCTQLDLTFLPKPTSALTALIGKQPKNVDPALGLEQMGATLAAAWPIAPRNKPALLHGDFWPGNLLWQAGQLVAVVDWEDAHIGDPLADLAISRLDLLTIFGREAMATFTAHYQALLPLDLTTLPYWDLCAALRLLRLANADFAAWATFFAPFGRTDISEETLRTAYHFFVSQALDKLAPA